MILSILYHPKIIIMYNLLNLDEDVAIIAQSQKYFISFMRNGTTNFFNKSQQSTQIKKQFPSTIHSNYQAFNQSTEACS